MPGLVTAVASCFTLLWLQTKNCTEQKSKEMISTIVPPQKIVLKNGKKCAEFTEKLR